MSYEELLQRRSIRKFTDQPVPKELLEKVIEAGLWAASGHSAQDSIIVAITNKEMRDKLAALNGQIWGKKIDPFYGAPIVLVVLGKKDEPNAIKNGSLVMGNLMQAAYDLGLGSCWINRADKEFEQPLGQEILASLGLNSEEYVGVGNCIIGYPGHTPRTIARKPGRVFWVE